MTALWASVLVAPLASSGLPRGAIEEVADGGVDQSPPLLATPVVTRPKKDARFFFKDLIVTFAWAPVPGAVGYRIQLGEDPDFQQRGASEDTRDALYVFFPRASGRYFFRVAALDSDGRLSGYSEPFPLHCEKDPPEDYLLSPQSGASVRYPKVAPTLKFSWVTAPGSPSYRFVLAKTEDLKTGVVQQISPASSIEIAAVPDGDYFWGVYLEDPFPYPLFLAPRPVTIREAKVDRVTAPTLLRDWGKQ